MMGRANYEGASFLGDCRFVLTASSMLAITVLIVISQVLASGQPLATTIISDSSPLFVL